MQGYFLGRLCGTRLVGVAHLVLYEHRYAGDEFPGDSAPCAETQGSRVAEMAMTPQVPPIFHTVRSVGCDEFGINVLDYAAVIMHLFLRTGMSDCVLSPITFE